MQKIQHQKSKALFITALSYVLILGWAYVLAWVESLFTDWGHHNAVRVYIWMPALLFVIAKLMSVSWATLCDFIAPSACIFMALPGWAACSPAAATVFPAHGAFTARKLTGWFSLFSWPKH